MHSPKRKEKERGEKKKEGKVYSTSWNKNLKVKRNEVPTSKDRAFAILRKFAPISLQAAKRATIQSLRNDNIRLSPFSFCPRNKTGKREGGRRKEIGRKGEKAAPGVGIGGVAFDRRIKVGLIERNKLSR